MGCYGLSCLCCPEELDQGQATVVQELDPDVMVAAVTRAAEMYPHASDYKVIT